MLSLNDCGQVSKGDVKGADIFASVIARLFTAGDRWYWDDGWNDNGLVGAILEHNAVTSSIVALVAQELCRIKCGISSGVTDSLPDLDLLLTSALAATT